MRFSILLLLVTFFSQISFAQNNPNRLVRKSRQQWVQYYTETELKGNWSLPIDAGFRWRNNFESPSQYLIRGAIAYTFESKLKLAAGFAHLGYYNGSNVNVTESRPYQEIGYGHSLGTIGISHRLRIEERFLKSDFSSESAVRFRYSLMLKLFELSISDTNPDLKFVFNFGNELFMSAGEEELPTAFTQNRLILSPTFSFSENFGVSVTWNSQYAATDESDVFDKVEVLWIQIRHTF